MGGNRRRRRAPGLGPAWRERLSHAVRPGWARTLLARRLLAGALVLLAAVLAVRGDPAQRTVDVVVAARDLPPGHLLTDDDVRTTAVGSEAVAGEALATRDLASGRTLAGGVRAGEQLTDVRVVGAPLAALATGRADAVSVPVRLSDADVADLLRPGDAVDVLIVGERAGEVDVIARDAAVLTVQPGDERRSVEGRLVVLGVDPDEAPSVAAASLESVVTITFR